MRFHHIGIVVSNINEQMQAYRASLAAEWDGQIFHDPNQKVRVAFLTTGPGDAQIELVEPAGPDSPVFHFLRDKGAGMHHVCYSVPDLAQALGDFKSRGAIIVKRAKPAVAFGGRAIGWVLTREKLLIELLESPDPMSVGAV
jgi:methylmalonyl-CoA/ethylmalonyl-CoA epimerase